MFRKNKSAADKKLLNRFTLVFDSAYLDTGFTNQFNTQNMKLIRTNLLMGAFLYIVFGILDRYVVPDVADTILIIRIICTVLLLFMAALSGSAGINIQLITLYTTLICGLGIVSMILISETSGAYYYYAGLLLVIWYAHGPLRMRFIFATAVSVTLTISYGLAVLLIKTTPFEIVLNNLFFMISANILGMFSSYGLEYYSRIAYWREEQLIKVRNELETESLRKTKELEDARQIQLSMLPSCADNISDLNICFDMRTAAEVGGDYYDYKISADGSLTLVLGDATGHGMKAGILVAVVKSLFINFKDDMDFNSFLNHCSNTIKSMHLGSLYMSLLMLKYKNGQICFTAAGMPPLFIYRAAKKEVEKITVKGMPLGAFESFNYTQSRTELFPGDTALLMTDGYPELFNPQNETLDYNRVSEIFCATDKSTASGIITQLFKEGDKWRGTKPQQDDVTFIAFKRNE